MISKNEYLVQDLVNDSKNNITFMAYNALIRCWKIDEVANLAVNSRKAQVRLAARFILRKLTAL